jgi:alpha-N-arabinofuranosidase
LVNLDPQHPAPVRAILEGSTPKVVSGSVLTAPAIDSVNTFEHPDTVAPSRFTDVALAAGQLTTTLPPKSVVVFDLR